MSDFVCGANEEGFHLAGVNWGRDLPEPQVADIRNVLAGDPSPDGKGTLEIARGIEVGHIFQLRTKYSAAMKATFLNEAGEQKPFEMGCYGIGVTRIVAAAIEQNHDARGIVFPAPIAPFEAAIVRFRFGFESDEPFGKNTSLGFNRFQGSFGGPISRNLTFFLSGALYPLRNLPAPLAVLNGDAGVAVTVVDVGAACFSPLLHAASTTTSAVSPRRDERLGVPSS